MALPTPHFFNVAIPCYSWNLYYRMQVCVNTLHMFICLFIHDICDIWWTCWGPIFALYISPLIRKKNKKSLRRWVFSDKSFLTSSRWSFPRKGGLAVPGYGWVLVVNVTVVPFSKVVGVELHTSSRFVRHSPVEWKMVAWASNDDFIDLGKG